MTQSSRAVPETGVDSGGASARLRPEPIDVAAWRQAMEGVTPEGWTVRVGQDGSLRLCIAGEPESGPVSLRNAQWVARCTVPAVLPLLDALAAKDRELAEADAEIVSSHCLIAEERQMRFAAERALDEAMAARREKEDRVKALGDVLTRAKAFHDRDSGCNGFTADYECLRWEINDLLGVQPRGK